MANTSSQEGRMKLLYRYEDIQYAPPLDEFDEPRGEGRVVVSLYAFPIVRLTPRGAWIATWLDGRKFVNLTARKRFACPTIEEAKESFVRRKEAQIRIYDARIRRAEKALAATLPSEPLIPLR